MKVDFTKRSKVTNKELARTGEGAIPVMIIYPSNPKYPGVLLNETFGSTDALKALKYVLKHSKDEEKEEDK